MTKINKVPYFFVLLLLINQCGVIKDGFSSNKKSSSDEFLVEKKAPLVMPPDYEELPLPNQGNQEIEEKSENIKNLIIKNKNKNLDLSINDQIDNSLEEKVLKKIKN